MIFLVLTLVVLMAEPGESVFGRLKAIFRGAKQGYKGKSSVKTKLALHDAKILCPL